MTSSSASVVVTGSPVLRSLSWSIAVVLVGGVLAVFTTPALPTRTVLQQGTGPVVPVAQEGPAAAAAAPAPEAAVPAAGGPAAPASTAPAATTAAPTTTKAKAAVAARSATSAAPKAAPATAAAPAPRLQPSPGSYPLSISGTSSSGPVPSSGSLVVESRGGDQQLRATGMPGDVVIVQRASTAGVDVVSFSLTAAGTTLSFVPPSPLPFVRNSGSWNWSVQSTDRMVTLNQTASASSAGSVNIGGTSVPAVTVTRVFSVTGKVGGNPVTGTVRLNSTVSLVDRLPLVQFQDISLTGTALVFSKTVTSTSTATVTSLTPR